MIGAGSEDSTIQALPDVQELFEGKESISIYSGINRRIFRGGAALTSEAMMAQNLNQNDPFGNLRDFKGLQNILTYSAALLCLFLIRKPTSEGGRPRS